MQSQRRQEVRFIKDGNIYQTVVEGQRIIGLFSVTMRVAEALDFGF